MKAMSAVIQLKENRRNIHLKRIITLSCRRIALYGSYRGEPLLECLIIRVGNYRSHRNTLCTKKMIKNVSQIANAITAHALQANMKLTQVRPRIVSTAYSISTDMG